MGNAQAATSQAAASEVTGLGGVSASLRLSAPLAAEASVTRTLNLPAQPAATQVVVIPATTLLAASGTESAAAMTFNDDPQMSAQLAVSVESKTQPSAQPVVNVVQLPTEPAPVLPAPVLSAVALPSSRLFLEPQSGSSSALPSSLLSNSLLPGEHQLPAASASLVASLPTSRSLAPAPAATVAVPAAQEPANQPYPFLPSSAAATPGNTAADLQLAAPLVKRVVFPQLPSLDLPELPGIDKFLPGDGHSITLRYVWPARGVFTSGYGPRWGRMHRGIDIAGPIGTPIVAAADGVVITSEWNSGGFGNLVKLRHADGSVTLYAHNHRNLVRVGQEVQQGEQIAEMGTTGRSTGPHLHFEIHPIGQGAVNPMLFLSRG